MCVVHGLSSHSFTNVGTQYLGQESISNICHKYLCIWPSDYQHTLRKKLWWCLFIQVFVAKGIA